MLSDLGHAATSWLGHGADPSQRPTPEGASHHAAAEQPSSWWGRLGHSVGDLGRGLHQEGLTGLLDPLGVIDRQQALRDLSSRFQVYGDDFIGPRRHNQVTASEYQKIAHTFSDIRLGRGDLRVDGGHFDGAHTGSEAARYKQGAMDSLANIMMTTAGRRQIESLHDNVSRDDHGNARRSLGFGPPIHHQTTIAPVFNEGQHTAVNLRHDNAFASAVRYNQATTRGPDGARNFGDHARIEWNPHTLDDRGDIALGHEMEHALHMTQGTLAAGAYGSSIDRDVDNCERQAVGLARSDSPAPAGYPGDPHGATENELRVERNELGLGERWHPRDTYAGEMPGKLANDDELRHAWIYYSVADDALPRR